MSRTLMRLGFFVALLTALLAIGTSSTAAMSPESLGDFSVQQDEPGPIEDLLPCDPTYDRSIEPRIFKIGEETTVRASYTFKCTGEARKINYFLVIENSGALRAGRGGREALDHVIEGAKDFVNQVDYANGSRGGLVLYAATSTIRLTLQGGDAGQMNLIQALHGISIEPIGDSAGAGAAIRDATGLLPTGVQTDAANVLIIVDAGATEVSDPLVTRYTALNAARQAGVTVAVISFPAAGRRMASGASGGWYKEVSDKNGGNVEQIFADLAEGMLRGKLMENVSYSESLVDGFELVQGSEYPRSPDFGPVYGAFGWDFGPDAPKSVMFNVRASEDLAGTGYPRKLTDFAEALFEYQDKTRARAYLPNPDVCVYRDDPAECAGLPPLTPTTSANTPAPTTAVPTDTPEATLAPTETLEATTPAATETSVPTTMPTHTPVPEGTSIYLPALYDKVPAG